MKFKTAISATRTALASAAILALASAGTATPASAQAAESFFKGRTVTVIVGFGAGGGYANYCRQLTQYWSEHTPGKPNFICQYMPGGGGVLAANYLANVAPSDGSVLGMISDYAALAQLLEPEKVKYDIRKFKWAGVMVPANPVMMVRKGARAQKFEDIYQTEMVVGLVGMLAQDGINTRLINNVLGTKMKGVAGYDATAKIALAMESGEVDASLSSWISWKTRAQSQMASGQFIPMFQIGFKKAWDLPDLPLIRDQAKSEDDRKLLDLGAGSAPFGRSVMVPPGYPPHLLAALREAFHATMKDKAFLDSAKEKNIEIDPSPGEDLEPIVAGIMSTPPALVERFREAAGIK
ncbi:MAG: tripartite tricarboxylate transporter substrate-binding protein [Rhodospirillaceae bacterium]